MIIDLSAIFIAIAGIIYGVYNSRQAKKAAIAAAEQLRREALVPVEQGAYDRAKTTLLVVIDEQDEKIRELYDEAKTDRAELVRVRGVNRQLMIKNAELDVEVSTLRERLDEMDKLIRDLQNKQHPSNG